MNDLTWRAQALAIPLWLLMPQWSLAHTVVFPQLPAVIVTPLPPPTSGDVVETRMPVIHAPDERPRSGAP